MERFQLANAKKENLRNEIQLRKLENEIESEKKKLPINVRKEIEREENRKKRLDIQDTKKSLWQLRHKGKKYETKSIRVEKLKEIKNLEEKLKEIKNVVEEIREEEKQAERQRKDRVEKIEKEKVKKKAEKLRKEAQRKEKIEKAKLLGKRWEMLRWLTEFLKENQEKWEIEKKARELENSKKLEEWEKAKRFEKIKKLKEKWSGRETKENMEENQPGRSRKVDDWTVWRKKEHQENTGAENGLKSTPLPVPSMPPSPSFPISPRPDPKMTPSPRGSKNRSHQITVNGVDVTALHSNVQVGDLGEVSKGCDGDFKPPLPTSPKKKIECGKNRN